ncbi:antitoxin of type II TA system, VapB [Quadrisphaera granulorum]|uniref:VapB protein of antitoxin of type II toxin-antitoxin system n=1 Tax=Quadrisphaera granulorum TaxID=317664 RepID=A0A315ZTP5_9ACTN|nr:type II toxin-antitoxin system VapB family antitoxin [Quadrisphaera granulorum]PWJ48280.1 VapB protein of antitoxin of type II toxin-antitoxin system [Quadrisphaera granulorum]SZE98441.1 antitoxin of type II TA system, VapB [Quadrisphaera granulorum]
MSTHIDDIDEKILAEAQDLLGAPTPQDAVNQALREAVRNRLVAQYMELMKQQGTSQSHSPRDDAWR